MLSERGHNIVMKNDPEMKILDENLVIVNPESTEDYDLMLARMETRRAKAKAEKAAKKAAKRKANGEAEAVPAKSDKRKDDKIKVKTSTVKNSSIQHDPTKSEAYKSLFSSHKSALNKPKGPWVTFDPRYN